MRLVRLGSFLSIKRGLGVTLISFFLSHLGLTSKSSRSSNSGKKGVIFTARLALGFLLSHSYKLLFVTIIAYAFGAGLSSVLEAKPCYGWACEIVECNDGYAVHIPEFDKYLPCEKFDQFIKTKNMRLLK